MTRSRRGGDHDDGGIRVPRPGLGLGDVRQRGVVRSSPVRWRLCRARSSGRVGRDAGPSITPIGHGMPTSARLSPVLALLVGGRGIGDGRASFPSSAGASLAAWWGFAVSCRSRGGSPQARWSTGSGGGPVVRSSRSRSTCCWDS